VRTVEEYGRVSIEVDEDLATCTVLDHAWTIASTTWEHLKSVWKVTPEDLIQKIRLDRNRQVALENG
jgi:hypothetical protein